MVAFRALSKIKFSLRLFTLPLSSHPKLRRFGPLLSQSIRILIFFLILIAVHISPQFNYTLPLSFCLVSPLFLYSLPYPPAVVVTWSTLFKHLYANSFKTSNMASNHRSVGERFNYMDTSFHEEDDDSFSAEHLSTPPPVIIKLAGEKSSFHSVSFKDTRKFIAALEELVGPLRDTHVGRSGDLFAFPTNDDQKSKLLEISSLGDVNFSCSLPKSGNSLRGVIYDVPTDEDPVELLGLLADHHVTAVTRRYSGPPPNKIPLSSVILDFEPFVKKLPVKVYMASRVFLVKPFYPRPYRCDKCWRIGHIQISCKSPTERCRRCSGPGHSASNCTLPVKCINCSSSQHESDFPFCPKFLARQNMIKYAIQNNISFASAMSKLSPLPPIDHISPNFAQFPPLSHQILPNDSDPIRPSGLWNLSNHPEFKSLQSKVSELEANQSATLNEIQILKTKIDPIVQMQEDISSLKSSSTTLNANVDDVKTQLCSLNSLIREALGKPPLPSHSTQVSPDAFSIRSDPKNLMNPVNPNPSLHLHPHNVQYVASNNQSPSSFSNG